MKLNLTVWQRETIRLSAGELRGSLAVMRKGAKILDVVELSKEEKKKVGYYITPKGPRWGDAEVIFPIEINDHEAANLTQRVIRELVEDLERREAWVAGEADELFDLCEQLKIDLDEVAAKIAEEKAKAEAEKKAKTKAKQQKEQEAKSEEPAD
jgi:hypothetical protein